MAQEGPRVSKFRHCSGCRYLNKERDYDGEKDEVIGYLHRCAHPQNKETTETTARYGDSTPLWCPFLQKPEIIVKADAAETGPRFLDMPERWLRDPKWRCSRGHVMTMYIKSERLCDNVCSTCAAPVWLTFPEDTERTIDA